MNEPAYNQNSSTSLKRSYRERLMRALKKFLMTIGIAYLIVVVALVLMENQMIYPAPKFPAGNWNPDFAHEDIEFTSADGTKLHAWLMRPEVQRDIPRYVLYCHGNGENISHCCGHHGLEIVHKLGGTVMAFDYRGYGKSEGSPSESGIKMDAERAYDVFCEQLEIKPEEVILMGQSLGGAVAVHLAAKKGCKALVVQRSFSSLPDVAADKYWWIPVRWLMQNNFDSAAAIDAYDGPLYQSHGQSDTIVPHRFGKKLFDNSTNGLSAFVQLPGIGHNDGFPRGYWQELDTWLNTVETNHTGIEPQPSAP